MTNLDKQQDNSEIETQAVKIHKTVGAWKALLKETQSKRFTGAVSMVVPFDSGRIGVYRTLVLPVRES